MQHSEATDKLLGWPICDVTTLSELYHLLSLSFEAVMRMYSYMQRHTRCHHEKDEMHRLDMNTYIMGMTYQA